MATEYKVRCERCKTPLRDSNAVLDRTWVRYNGKDYRLLYLVHSGCGGKTFIQVDDHKTLSVLQILESQLQRKDKKAARKTNAKLDKMRAELHDTLNGKIVTLPDGKDVVVRLVL